MQVQVTFDGADRKSLVAVLAALGALDKTTVTFGADAAPKAADFESEPEKSDTDEQTDQPQRRKRRTKAEMEAARAAEETESVDENNPDGYDLGDDVTEPSLTLDQHVIPAFQEYAKRHSRDKAAAILTKYKVKSVRDLPESKFAEVIKLLK